MKVITLKITDFDEEFYQEELECLEPLKRSRAQRFRRAEDRKLSVLGDYGVRLLASQYLGSSPSDITVMSEESGRPYIGTPSDTGIYCSISHSGEYAAACIGSAPVGIDIERIAPVQSSLIEASCTPSEIEYISIHGDDSFYRIWTAKEAYLKCLGTGLGNISSMKDIDSFNLPSSYVTELYEDTPEYVISICSFIG